MYKKDSMRASLSATLTCCNVICVLLTFALLTNYIGITPPSLAHLIAIYLVVGMILLNLPLQHTIRSLKRKNAPQVKLTVGIIILICSLLLFILSKTQLLWCSSVPLLICGLDLILHALDRRRKELILLAVASFGYTIVILLLETLPFFWYFYQQSSLSISSAIGIITGTPLSLGPTASGLGILLIFLITLVSAFFLNSRKTRKEILWLGITVIALLFVWILYLLILDTISFTSKNEVFNLHLLFFIFCLIPLLGYLLRYKSKEPLTRIDFLQSSKIQVFRNGAIWAAVLLLLSVVLLTSFVNTTVVSEGQPKVVFYGDHMVGTWDFPQYGKYGKDAVGMFGLWPVYLTTLGYETEIIVHNKSQFLQMLEPPDQNITSYLNFTDYTTVIESDAITRSLLDSAAIFVISNLNISFSTEEHTIIWDYVNEGGSLLVIGDHTNVGGIQKPLNDLLTPVGIRYRFDAALPLDEKFKWLTSTHLLYHPITAFLGNPNVLQYGIGASLDITPSCFPLMIGTAALSDSGNQTNDEIAYLGDYEYNKGEQLGDVILVAGAYYGQGKVLVFGDTSTFQNPALPFSYPFFQRVFSWLVSTQTATNTMIQIGTSVLLLLAALLVYRFFRYKTKTFALFPMILCLSLLLSYTVNPLLSNNEIATLHDNIVFIDAAHNERFSLESFTDDSVNGLILNLQRNNYLPVILEEISQEKIVSSQILIYIAPTSLFTADEVTFLKKHMANGGFIILATGFDDKAASLPLLQAFDVDVEPTPLGPVPYVEGNLTNYQNEPRFVDSWPLSFPDKQGLSYYNFTWGNLTFHLVVFLKYGSGGLLVIGDSQYLLDKNIESIYDYWPGNILFLKYLLNELDAVEVGR